MAPVSQAGRAAGLDLLGDRVPVGGEARPQPSLVAEVTPAAVSEVGLAEGSDVWVSIKATEVRVYPAYGRGRRMHVRPGTGWGNRDRPID